MLAWYTKTPPSLHFEMERRRCLYNVCRKFMQFLRLGLGPLWILRLPYKIMSLTLITSIKKKRGGLYSSLAPHIEALASPFLVDRATPEVHARYVLQHYYTEQYSHFPLYRGNVCYRIMNVLYTHPEDIYHCLDLTKNAKLPDFDVSRTRRL